MSTNESNFSLILNSSNDLIIKSLKSENIKNIKNNKFIIKIKSDIYNFKNILFL